jgi:cystathionine beta-lyase/cystathionine gamma-synthase
MADPPCRPATAAIHARRAESAARPISSPIFQSSTFASASAEDFARVAVEVATPDFYTRHGNPNHVELANVVATLEGAGERLGLRIGPRGSDDDAAGAGQRW